MSIEVVSTPQQVGAMDTPTLVRVVSGSSVDWSESQGGSVQGTIAVGQSATFDQFVWVWSTGGSSWVDVASVSDIDSVPSSVANVSQMGVVADASGPGGTGTDNYAAIMASLATLAAGGQSQPLPAGKIGVSQPIVVPAGVTLLGTGSDSTDVSPVNGTVIVPLSTFSSTRRVVELTNTAAAIRNLSVDAGTQCYGAAYLNASDNRLDDVYFCGGTKFTLDSGSSCQHPRLHSVRATPHAANIQTTTVGVLNSQGADWQADATCYFENGSKVLAANNSIWTGVHFINASGGGVPYGSGGASNANIIDYGAQRLTGCYIDSVVLTASTALIDRSSATSTSYFDACTYDQSTTAGGGAAGAITGPVVLETANAQVGAIMVGGGIQVGSGWTFTEWVQAPIASTIIAFLKIPSGVLATGFADTTTPLGIFTGIEISGAPANIGLDLTGSGDPNTTSIPGQLGATYKRTAGALGSTLYTRVGSGATNGWARPSDLRVTSQTASFTVGVTDDVTRVSTVAGNVVATLGTGAAPWPPPPRLFRFIKTTSDANQVTFAAGTGAIQGTSPTLSALGDCATFFFDGTNWFVVGVAFPTKSVITSLTSPPVSGTAYQNTTGRDLDCYLNWTPGSATSDVAVSVSPDNVTYTQIADPHSGVTNTQTQDFRVPAGWYYKCVLTGTGAAMNSLKAVG